MLFYHLLVNGIGTIIISLRYGIAGASAYGREKVKQVNTPPQRGHFDFNKIGKKSF